MTKIGSAYDHIVQELGFDFDKAKVSLEVGGDFLKKSHDAIHEYLMLASLFFPLQGAQKSDWDSDLPPFYAPPTVRESTVPGRLRQESERCALQQPHTGLRTQPVSDNSVSYAVGRCCTRFARPR